MRYRITRDDLSAPEFILIKSMSSPKKRGKNGGGGEKKLEIKDGSLDSNAFIWRRRRDGKTSLKIPELELGKQ